jgi:hypothetical protein
MPSKLTKPKNKPGVKKPLAKKIKPNGKHLVKPQKAFKPKSTLSRFKPFKSKLISIAHTKNVTKMVMMLGDDGKGKLRPIEITNNLDATNPSLYELNSFLGSDDAQALSRKKPIKGKYECGDFARDLHDLAERNGIRCGFVVIYYNHGSGHGMNVFDTRDHGLIFVDFAMGARYDTDRLLGNAAGKEGKDGKNFFDLWGKLHFETESGRFRNIDEVSITW